MGNEILDATLVDPDDGELPSDIIRPRGRRETDRSAVSPGYRDPDLASARDPPSAEAVDGDPDDVSPGEPVAKTSDAPVPAPAEAPGELEDLTRPEVSRGGVTRVDPVPDTGPRPGATTPGLKDTRARGRRDRPPLDMMQAAALAVVLLIVLAGAWMVLNREEKTDFIVTVPGIREGDEARYSVSGRVDIRGVRDEPIMGEITDGWIDLRGSTMFIKARGIARVTDGYYREYDALLSETDASWKLKGEVTTVSHGEVLIDGTIQLTSEAYRNGNTILKNDMEARTDIRAESKRVGFYSRHDQSEDTLRTYSSDASDLQASFDQVIRRPNLRRGDAGVFENEDVAYTWAVTGNDRVYNADCVIVTFTVTKPTGDRIQSQSITLYLSSEHPFPVKTHIRVVTRVGDQGGTVTVEYTARMDHYRQGGAWIIIPEDNIVTASPYLDLRTMLRYPQTGQLENSSIIYRIEDAHDQAKERSQGLRDYLDDHPTAFLVQGIYNETDGPLWNLTYSYPGSTTGYAVLVTETRITDRGIVDLKEMGYLLSVDSPPATFITSWAGAEQVLKHDPVVKDGCFDGGEHLNLYSCRISVRSSLYQPSVDPVSLFASVPRVDYGYLVVKGDELAAGVDGRTGQLLFVLTHDGPSLF